MYHVNEIPVTPLNIITDTQQTYVTPLTIIPDTPLNFLQRCWQLSLTQLFHYPCHATDNYP